MPSDGSASAVNAGESEAGGASSAPSGAMGVTQTSGGRTILSGSALTDAWIDTWIKSVNYSPGLSGFFIDGISGNVEFGNGKFRGSITALTGSIGGWLIMPTLLKSADSGARIELNQALNRISIFDAVNEKVAMGYLNGLPKNDGSGNWGVSNYGFWARSGDKLSIDGDGEYISGDWMIQNDASYLVKDSLNNTIVRLGTDTGEKGVFIYNTAGTQLAKYISDEIFIGITGSYLQYTVAGGLVVSGNISASTIDIGGSDATSFHVDIDGNLWSGAATFATAPFSVSNDGDVTAKKVIASNLVLYEAVVDAGGDGDYTDIQAALTAGKTRIFVRNGTYNLGADITITADDVYIVGESRGGVNIVGNVGATEYGISISGDRCTLINLKKDRSTTLSNYGIYITGHDYTLDNVIVYDTHTSNSSGIWVNGGKNGVIKNCTIDVPNVGVTIDGCSSTNMFNNLLNGYSSNSIVLDGSSKSMISSNIVNVTSLYSNGDTFHAADVDTGTDQITTTVDFNSYQYQQVYFTTDGSLPSALTPGTLYYLMYVDATHIQVAATYDDLWNDIFIDFTDQGSGTNVIHYGGNFVVIGISDSGGEYNVILGNTITGNQYNGQGVLMQSDNGIVESNVISGFARGIYGDDCDATSIVGNKIKECVSGIQGDFSTGSRNVVISNNSVASSLNYGFSSWPSAGMIFSNNSIYKSKLDGVSIGISGNVRDFIVSNNIVSDCIEDGFYIRATGYAVTNAVITSNFSFNNDGYGFHLDDTTLCTMVGNIAGGNGSGDSSLTDSGSSEVAHNVW
jgi:hypothetical protein